jgi:alkylation response protein AidB-like acyl-CoA dehydrogenase
MDFNLTEEQKILQSTVRSFIKKEVKKELIDELDEKEEYPSELAKRMAELGWFALPFPEEYGGIGGKPMDVAVLLEELGYGMMALAGAYIMNVVFGGLSIYHYGNEEQKKYYLPKLARGEIKFALSVTEPNAGSDIASLTTSAKKDGDYYIINGSKVFSTGAHVADYLVTATRTDPTLPKHKGITMFLVPTNTPGVEIRRLKKLGMRSVGTNEIFFDNVKIPKENMLGNLNEGWKNMLKTLSNERVYAGAVAVGGAQRVLDDVINYAKERVQFGQPISKFQAIQFMLADMSMEIELARLITYYAVWRVENGLSAMKEVSMAKLYPSEVYTRVANKGLQIMGGYGYMMEYEVQRHLRDAKFFEIAGGTSEIQRVIIANELGL